MERVYITWDIGLMEEIYMERIYITWGYWTHGVDIHGESIYNLRVIGLME